MTVAHVNEPRAEQAVELAEDMDNLFPQPTCLQSNPTGPALALREPQDAAQDGRLLVRFSMTAANGSSTSSLKPCLRAWKNTHETLRGV